MSLRATPFALVFLATAASAQAGALLPLNENPYVMDRLLAARVADRIRNECPSISARYVAAYMALRDLKSWAVKQGYTPDDVNALLDNRDARKALKAEAEDYLAANGATDEAGFCALGRAEIEKGSLIGSLISED